MGSRLSRSRRATRDSLARSSANGMLADMVLLSDDVLIIDPVKIRDVKVLKTWVGGKLVYDAK